jgi:hypothetical protein
MSSENQEKKVPAVGQRWRDNDPRFQDRVREVLILEKLVCLGQVGRDAFKCLVYVDGKSTRQTKIRADRFKPTATGYKYVGEGAP